MADYYNVTYTYVVCIFCANSNNDTITSKNIVHCCNKQLKINSNVVSL